MSWSTTRTPPVTLASAASSTGEYVDARNATGECKVSACIGIGVAIFPRSAHDHPQVLREQTVVANNYAAAHGITVADSHFKIELGGRVWFDGYCYRVL